MNIYIAGHTGLVGQAVSALALAEGHSLKEVPRIDLRDRAEVFRMFDAHMSDVDAVVVAAARVGGIGANAGDPIGFLLDNIRISTNLIEAAAEHGIERLVNLGSSCIYPRDCPQPIREEYLLTGPLEPTNTGYAVAKIAALQLTEFYRRDAFPRYTSLMPTNLYGPGDTYHESNSHVIPALIMKFCRAVGGGYDEVMLWGSGNPLREFMHVSDLASAVLLTLDQPSTSGWMNVGSGEEATITELAARIGMICGFEGEIAWMPEYPDGTPRKLLDSSRIRSLGWEPRITLDDGLRQTIRSYMESHGPG